MRRRDLVLSIVRNSPDPLRERLRVSGIGQRDIATHLGKSASFVNERLNGYREFSDEDRSKIKALLSLVEGDDLGTENGATDE